MTMKLEIIKWNDLTEDEKITSIQRPTLNSLKGQDSTITQIFKDVRADGDEALKKFTSIYDGVKIDDFLMSEKEIDAAFSRVPRDLIQSIENAIENVKTFHEKNFENDLNPVEVKSGINCQIIKRPIEKVGLYIPAGNNPLPSTAIMLGVPSSLARNKQSVVVSPPNDLGVVNDAVTVAAKLSGIGKIFKVGGAQSIAALALGTESIPLPAGPTEVMIISDGNTNPEFIAYDLLSQAEHGIDSQVILISQNDSFLKDVAIEIDIAMSKISTREIAEISMKNSMLILTDNIDEALSISNDYAPEHLIINCKNAEELLPGIQSAGDYCSGTNHVLPTAGFARSYSGLSVDSFCKTISVQSLSKEGLESIGDDIINLAMAEGLEAHARAVEVRIKK